MRKFSIKIVIVLVIALSCSSLSAQIGVPGEESIQFSVSPSVPQPNFRATAKVESYIVNLDNMLVSWFINGEAIKSGLGEKQLVFETGEPGSSTTVSVVVGSGPGATEFSRSIVPQQVSLVWEARSYTPPFYRGRGLFPPGGNVRIMAIPNITTTSGASPDPSTLIYTWKKEGKVLGANSGVGKQYVDIFGTVLDDSPSIEVVVSTGDKKHTARGAITIPTTQPELILYENDPLLGVMFNKALEGNTNLSREEITIEVHPFYFSDGRETPKYSWKVNGDRQNNASASITLKKPEASGIAAISTKAQHEIRILQSAEKFLKIKFQK